MIFSKYTWNLLFWLTAMFVVMFSMVFAFFTNQYALAIVLLPVLIGLLSVFYRFHKRTQDEMEQFIEAVYYRDFSRHYSVQAGPKELRTLRRGFNEINAIFKEISQEKETQHQYLKTILDIVDTGILSYEIESGEIMWMNESFKKLLGLPYMKNIESLTKRETNLANYITGMKAGEKNVVSVISNKNAVKVLLTASLFQTEKGKYKLVAFHNVSEALDETESKAWQKLLSVLTHEIMNSVAPISSLAQTLKHSLEESGNFNQFPDLKLGIDTIQKRSEGLLKFTETYRYLNKINTLKVGTILIRELFENLYRLMGPTLEQKEIEMDIVLPDPDLILHADSSLLEQVLINLLVNAIDAVKSKSDPRIILSAYLAGSKIYLKVVDNGEGMDENVQEQIFIPFFSTKKTGSGIGLSLCKQIMVLHKGSIHVTSKLHEGSAFTLEFSRNLLS